MWVDIGKYDGTLLHHRFAYQYFRKECSPLGNLLVFRAPMEVLADGMIDQEDVLQQAFIYSEDALNIVWELPIITNPFGAVAYQCLLNQHIANILSSADLFNHPIQVDGDDLFVGDGKCSVSITHVKQNAALGHTGINIHAGSKAPSHAFSTQLNNEQVQLLGSRIIDAFYELNQNLFSATTKILAK